MSKVKLTKRGETVVAYAFLVFVMGAMFLAGWVEGM